MIHVGIDLHQKYSEICEIAEGGSMERSQIPSTEAAFRRWFAGRRDLRVVVECGGSSRWVARLLRDLGCEVLVVNPRRMRLIAESKMKTDRVDAKILAQLSRLSPDFLRPVYERSDEANLTRTRLGVRTKLVRSRTAMINAVRGSLRSLGIRLPGKATSRIVASYGAARIPPAYREALDPLIETIVELTKHIDELTANLERQAASDPLLQRLRGVGGVGPIVSIAFTGWIDDPQRFRRSRDVGAYAGLTSSLRASGGREQRGRITREGDAEMRRLLVQSAHALLRCRRDSALKTWGLQLAERIGKKKAAVAVARKIAVVLHHLWVTGQEYQPFPAAA